MRKFAVLLASCVTFGCTTDGNSPDFARFFENNPETVQAPAQPSPFDQAEEYRRTGHPHQAIAIYDSLLATDPDSPSIKESKALALIAAGEFDTAPALLDEVMKTDPTRWKTLNALGILFSLREMQSEAQQYYAEALKFSPSNPAVLNNQGLSYALSRQYEPAVRHLLQAAALRAPGSRERQHTDSNLALVYASSGRLDDARSVAAGYYSGRELDNNMGIYAHLAKDDRLAASYLHMALTQSKTAYPKAWKNLATMGASAQPPAPRAPDAAFIPSLSPAAGVSLEKKR